MAKLIASAKSVSFDYNFLVHGGAVGSIPMSVFIPTKCLIKNAWVTPMIGLSSAGAATVDIGFAVIPNWIINNSIATSGNYTDYNLATFGFLTPFNSGNINILYADLTPDGIPIPANLEILVTIGTAPLTQGRFIISIDYQELNF